MVILKREGAELSKKHKVQAIGKSYFLVKGLSFGKARLIQQQECISHAWSEPKVGETLVSSLSRLFSGPLQSEDAIKSKEWHQPKPENISDQKRSQTEGFVKPQPGKAGGQGDSKHSSHWFKISVNQHRYFLLETRSVTGLFTGTSAHRTAITKLLL